MFFLPNPKPPAAARLAALLLVLLPPPAPAAEAAPRPPNDHFVQPESTKQMIAEVAQIYRNSDPTRNPFRSADSIKLMRAAEAGSSDPSARLSLKMQIAQHLLKAGLIEESLKELDEIDAFVRQNGWTPEPVLQATLLTQRAMCHLRTGETVNCQLNHNQDSCLFPLQGGGIHQVKDG